MAGEQQGNPNPPDPNAAAEKGQQQQGEQQKTWLDGAPEPLKANKSLTKFKDPYALGEAYVNLESMLGKRFEDHLKPDAPDEIKGRVRAAMGVPEAANGYEDPKLPEGVEITNKELLGGFKEAAFKAGLSKTQAGALMGWYLEQEMGQVAGAEAEIKASYEAGEKALKGEWGAAYDYKVGLCQSVVATLGPDFKAALDETGAGNDPRVVKALTKVGEILSEEGILKPVTEARGPKQAAEEYAKLQAEALKDPKHPWMNKNHPEHDAWVRKMAGLAQEAWTN